MSEELQTNIPDNGVLAATLKLNNFCLKTEDDIYKIANIKERFVNFELRSEKINFNKRHHF